MSSSTENKVDKESDDNLHQKYTNKIGHSSKLESFIDAQLEKLDENPSGR